MAFSRGGCPSPTPSSHSKRLRPAASSRSGRPRPAASSRGGAAPPKRLFGAVVAGEHYKNPIGFQRACSGPLPRRPSAPARRLPAQAPCSPASACAGPLPCRPSAPARRRARLPVAALRLLVQAPCSPTSARSYLICRSCAGGADPAHALKLLSAAVEDHGVVVVAPSTYRVMVVGLCVREEVDGTLKVSESLLCCWRLLHSRMSKEDILKVQANSGVNSNGSQRRHPRRGGHGRRHPWRGPTSLLPCGHALLAHGATYLRSVSSGMRQLVPDAEDEVRRQRRLQHHSPQAAAASSGGGSRGGTAAAVPATSGGGVGDPERGGRSWGGLQQWRHSPRPSTALSRVSRGGGGYLVERSRAGESSTPKGGAWRSFNVAAKMAWGT
ncbi:hypothetical protein U9M48_035592 [Paspalum notatum var. saurae]|uniref:Uncharacterized protein n=1 Tax=Paspalum notatum var. saurae TaxID=547442 RepID=A0AAQ3UCY2_PASNO